MKTFRCALVLAAAVATHAIAAGAFAKWWPQFQTAVAASNVKAVSEGVQYPLNWENGKIREIKSQDEFAEKFDRYFTPEIKKIVAARKPERLPNGSYSITWKARGNEYSIYFRAVDGAFALDGLSEGPP
jgi:hypothetical protein